MRPGLATLRYALGSRRLVAWSTSLSKIRHRLGFLKDDGDEPEDLVDVGEDDGEEAWMPFREVQYRWRRDAKGRLAYHLWAIKPIAGLDHDECDHDDELDLGRRFRGRSRSWP